MDSAQFFAYANATPLFLIVGGILLFVSIMCVVFMLKSWRAGVAIGMDKKVLKRSIVSSLTFTLLPSISILLGVVALSGSLGIPVSWLRLSVVGSLHYELQVANMAATNIGMSGLTVSEMTMSGFATIVLVMTVGILGGALCSVFLLKPYLKRVQGGKKKTEPAETTPAPDGSVAAKPGQGFGAIATSAMFIGLCSAYIGAYVGTFVRLGDAVPLITAGVAALAMAIFEFFTVKKKMGWLDNFSLAASMLLAMAVAVFVS